MSISKHRRIFIIGLADHFKCLVETRTIKTRGLHLSATRNSGQTGNDFLGYGCPSSYILGLESQNDYEIDSRELGLISRIYLRCEGLGRFRLCGQTLSPTLLLSYIAYVVRSTDLDTWSLLPAVLFDWLTVSFPVWPIDWLADSLSISDPGVSPEIGYSRGGHHSLSTSWERKREKKKKKKIGEVAEKGKKLENFLLLYCESGFIANSVFRKGERKREH